MKNKWTFALGLLILAPGLLSAQARSNKEEVCYDGKPASWWIKAMKDRSASYRLKAVESLTEIGADGDGVVTALIAALKDKNAGVRAKVALGLGQIGRSGGEGVEPALVAALADKDEGVRSGAARALGKIALGPELAAEFADVIVTDYRVGGKPWVKVTIGRSDTKTEFYGGDIVWVKKIPNLREVELVACDWRVSDRQSFKCLKEIPSLRKLALHNSSSFAEDLANLKDAVSLEELDLDCCGEALAHVAELPRIRKLNLVCIEATHLVHLKKMKGLEELTLCSNVSYSKLTRGYDSNLWLTSDPFEHIEGLTNLRKLKLQAFAFDDAGLVHLRGLTKLTELDLRETKVTAEGAESLRKALPDTKILVDIAAR